MEKPEKLLLIDGHALLHRAYHAIPGMTSPSGFPTGAIYGFLSMFFKALADIQPTHALVVFDVPGPTFRDKLAADYKAQRKAPDAEMIQQEPKLKEILTALNIPVYEKAGFEADDLLGIITDKTPKQVQNIIATGDLDMLQLIDNHTQVYRFKIGLSDIQIFDTNEMLRVYGLHPSQWVDYKAIRGDASDNIPGVPGIGEKGALELVKTFGSLEDIYAAVEKKDKRIKPAMLKKLEAGRAKAALSKKLAHIDQKHPFEFNLSDCRLGNYDQSKVLEIFKQLGIKALISRLPKTSHPLPKETLGETKLHGKNKAKLIKTPVEARIAAYLLNPGRRDYDVSDQSAWDHLEHRLKDKKLLHIFQEIELPLIPILGQMEQWGIKLDINWLKHLSKLLTERIEDLSKKIYKLAGEKFNIASPIQLREVLFDKLQIPTENLRKTSKTKAYSTDAVSLEKLRDLHPIIDLIFEYREMTKLKSTYVDALPELVSPADDRLHTTYSQTIAATGRLSSSEPNLQNIPIRSELGNQVRKAFVAEEGFVLASLDYSQIELRIAATLSKDPEMIKIFKHGGDFHSATASKIFEVPEAKITPQQRRDAKTINFSVLYGVSAFGLSERSEMSREEASQFIKKYFTIFKRLKEYIEDVTASVHKHGYVVNPLGRLRYFPEVHSSNYQVRAAAERAAVNMPMQSLAADILKLAMIKIAKDLDLGSDCRMLLQVHDELVFEIKEGKADEFVPKIKKIMETVYKLDVPILADAKTGPNWLEMEEYKG